MKMENLKRFSGPLKRWERLLFYGVSIFLLVTAGYLYLEVRTQERKLAEYRGIKQEQQILSDRLATALAALQAIDGINSSLNQFEDIKARLDEAKAERGAIIEELKRRR